MNLINGWETSPTAFYNVTLASVGVSAAFLIVAMTLIRYNRFQGSRYGPGLEGVAVEVSLFCPSFVI